MKKPAPICPSIKESIDNLPMGMCFANSRGIVMLLNRRMLSLSHAVIGCDLQSIDEFWQTLTCEKLAPGSERLNYGVSPVVRIPDGTVWAFSRKELFLAGRPVTRLLASEITDLDDTRNSLAEANQRLADMNRRLRQYGQDVTELTAQEERLAAKVRIHDELGSVLLATRHFLTTGGKGISAGSILDQWRRDVTLLRGSAEEACRNSWTTLDRAARFLGVTLSVQGASPVDKRAESLLIRAVGEALNNAVRHGDAKNLTVVLSHTPTLLTARITNDGAVPERLVEGGGLSALRQNLEEQGGTLVLRVEPPFTVTVTIPLIQEAPQDHDKSADH